eukprot:755409-Hanusia_phi.AAC.1
MDSDSVFIREGGSKIMRAQLLEEGRSVQISNLCVLFQNPCYFVSIFFFFLTRSRLLVFSLLLPSYIHILSLARFGIQFLPTILTQHVGNLVIRESGWEDDDKVGLGDKDRIARGGGGRIEVDAPAIVLLPPAGVSLAVV